MRGKRNANRVFDKESRLRSSTRIRESIRVKIRAKFHLRESMWIRVKLTKTCCQKRAGTRLQVALKTKNIAHGKVHKNWSDVVEII